MPLMFDFPFEELKNYQGITPRPADFDDYWQKGLQEMKSVDPQVEIKPADFHAPGVECSDLFFTGVGGARVHAKLLRPQKTAQPQYKSSSSYSYPLFSLSIAPYRGAYALIAWLRNHLLA